MSILITGGAGFIGSCIVRSLNDRGIYDLIISDNITGNKELNLNSHRYVSYVPKEDLLESLEALTDITVVIHMGACSSTTITDWDYLYHNNFKFSCTLWNHCARHQIPFIYASSAATYGDGAQGFDDECDIDTLKPLNMYAKSKQMFDMWIKHDASIIPPQHVGLKFFNVYGPNEYFKGDMSSIVYKGYRQIIESGWISLFKSYDPNYPDGGQLRDFVYVKDICDVILWFMDHPDISGLFNVGTGHAVSFSHVAEVTFRAMGMTPNIEYIDMPDTIRQQYQYYTQAKMDKLRSSGYEKPFTSPEDGVTEYVQEYLSKGYRIY